MNALLSPSPSIAASQTERLQQALTAFTAAGMACHTDTATLRSKSRDYYWYSPVLTELLDGKIAELVVQPKNTDELRQIAALSARLRLPVTLRGGGTGNYGQCVPMEGGIVIETLHLNAIKIHPESLSATVQTGCIIEAIEIAARAQGLEILMFPSTLREATIGGFVAGGFGGVGSIRHGVLKDAGNISRIQVMTLEETPQIIELQGSEIQKVHHAFGTNGIITEIDMRLAPAQDWRHVIALFDSYEATLAFGLAAMRPDVPLRLLTSVARDFAPYYGAFGAHFPAHKDAIFALVEAGALADFAALAADFGGQISLSMTDAEIAASGLPPAYECAYNHTTLMALKVDKSWTYMQLAFPQPFSVALAMELVHEFGAEIIWHHEFSLAYGSYGVFAIPLVAFLDAERLNEIKERIEALGVGVFDAHVITIEDGGMKTIDTAQIDFKKIADPHGLMNPGKTRGWLAEYAAP